MHNDEAVIIYVRAFRRIKRDLKAVGREVLRRDLYPLLLVGLRVRHLHLQSHIHNRSLFLRIALLGGRFHQLFGDLFRRIKASFSQRLLALLRQLIQCLFHSLFLDLGRSLHAAVRTDHDVV